MAKEKKEKKLRKIKRLQAQKFIETVIEHDQNYTLEY